MRPEPPDLQPSLIVFLDMEASGLHGASVPTEIGLAVLDTASGRIAVWSQLIGHEDALVSEVWDPQAVAVTGIYPGLLIEEGRPPAEVVANAGRFLEVNGLDVGSTPRIEVVSDAPSFDGRWLAILRTWSTKAGGEDLPVRVAGLREVLARFADAVGAEVEARLAVSCSAHRAGSDARRLAEAMAEALGCALPGD